ncbi:MAG: 50S ribosomal protein L21 [Myxococcales bacterium]|nr:50S ribosomal protein L21 [Myxococcales bacterium]
MYAVVRTGGKQYRVEPGQLIRVELLEGAIGDFVDLEVLAVGSEAGLKTGDPILTGASVKARIQEHGKGQKIQIFKHRRRKHYRRSQGHRQGFTALAISEINAG